VSDQYSHPSKTTGKIIVLLSQYLHSIKYPCPIIIFYRTTLSPVCPDDDTAKAFLSVWNFNKFFPNLQNKYLERWITTTKQHIPDFSFVSFNTASPCRHYVRAKHVFCAWQMPDKCHCKRVPAASPLHKEHINQYCCGILIGRGTSRGTEHELRPQLPQLGVALQNNVI